MVSSHKGQLLSDISDSFLIEKIFYFESYYAEISSHRSYVCTLSTDAFSLIIIHGRRSALNIFVVNGAFTAMMFSLFLY